MLRTDQRAITQNLGTKTLQMLSVCAYERQPETSKFKANPADVIFLIQVCISILHFFDLDTTEIIQQLSPGTQKDSLGNSCKPEV